MSLAYAIDPVARIVEISVRDAPSAAAMIALLEAIEADPQYRPGFGILSDRRTSEPQSAASVRHVSAHVVAFARRVGPFRWAVVVSDAAGYGMARMSQTLVSDSSIESRIFTDLEDARRWLAEGRAEDQTQPATA